MEYRTDKGELPPPNERTRQDYPPSDELFVYGEDYPLPQSEGDLLVPYNFPEGVTWEDLEGYKVPPLGLKVMASGAATAPRGKSPMVYGAGTFLEDKVSFGKELGIAPKEAIAIREENRRDALVQGIREAFEERGIDAMSDIKTKEIDVVREMAKQTTMIILESKSPREMLNLLKYFDKRMADKEEAISKNREQAAMTPDEAKEWFELYREARTEGFDFEVIDGEVEELD